MVEWIGVRIYEREIDLQLDPSWLAKRIADNPFSTTEQRKAALDYIAKHSH